MDSYAGAPRDGGREWDWGAEGLRVKRDNFRWFSMQRKEALN
jgi:hypothetical protein